MLRIQFGLYVITRDIACSVFPVSGPISHPFSKMDAGITIWLCFSYLRTREGNSYQDPEVKVKLYRVNIKGGTIND